MPKITALYLGKDAVDQVRIDTTHVHHDTVCSALFHGIYMSSLQLVDGNSSKSAITAFCIYSSQQLAKRSKSTTYPKLKAVSLSSPRNFCGPSSKDRDFKNSAVMETMLDAVDQ